MTTNSKKYFLSILAIFKNESHILDEWINTHINEGVEHFYLIDNNSSDNFMEIIKKYENIITLIQLAGPHQQVNAYNTLKELIISETSWIAIIDLDEFIFSTKKDTKLIDYVKEYQLNGAEGIYLPWIMYGSSFFKNQPDSVIKNFIYRKFYNKDSYIGGKSIVKTNSIQNYLHVHLTNINDNNLYVNGNCEFKYSEWFGECPDVFICEEKIKNMNLRINHYPIQSEDFFMKIKATRGDATTHILDNIRDKNYFNNYDKNEVLDDILKIKYF